MTRPVQSSSLVMEEAIEVLKNSRETSVIVIGDFILDHYIWGKSKRISPEAPVPVVHIQSEVDCLGGAGNVVANLRGLGIKVIPIGVVGDDNPGERIRDLLSEIGCPCDGLLKVSDRPTIEKTRVIAQTQHVLRIDRETLSPFPALVFDGLWEYVIDKMAHVDVCVISDYSKGVCHPRFLRRVFDLAYEKRIPILVDPKSKDFSIYAGADCITPNLLETAQVVALDNTDEASVANAARELHEGYEFENVLITRGPDGMTLLTRNAIRHIPAQAREVYDVSGAGDTVIATLAAGIGGGLSYEDAAQLANIAAGIVVGKLGTVPISLKELEQVIHVSGISKYHTKIMRTNDFFRHLEVWRTEGKKIVFTNGCFDILHLGHITLLANAKDLGDILIVGVNTDNSVKRLKGADRPLNDEMHRTLVLAGLESVDAVVLFDEDTPIELIRIIKPDVLVKGSDYSKDTVVGREFVESNGGEVVLLPLVNGYSTTNLLQKINTIREGGERK